MYYKNNKLHHIVLDQMHDIVLQYGKLVVQNIFYIYQI